MPRKPNYRFERKERERLKAEKKAERTAARKAARAEELPPAEPAIAAVEEPAA